MNLQQKTLKRYRQFFPQDSLREVSFKTGIQITRIYRLFAGKNMKVEELETFERLIDQKLADNPQLARMNKIMDEAYASLTDDEISKIADYVSRKVKIKSFCRFYINNYHNVVIA